MNSARFDKQHTGYLANAGNAICTNCTSAINPSGRLITKLHSTQLVERSSYCLTTPYDPVNSMGNKNKSDLLFSNFTTSSIDKPNMADRPILLNPFNLMLVGKNTQRVSVIDFVDKSHS